jgi:hypothetical protein
MGPDDRLHGVWVLGPVRQPCPEDRPESVDPADRPIRHGLPDGRPERPGGSAFRSARRQEVPHHVRGHHQPPRHVPPGVAREDHQHLVPLGVGAGGERGQSHRHPACGRTATPHRSRTSRETFGPVHSPPSGGRFSRAANSSPRRSSVRGGLPRLLARRSVRPPGPSAFHRSRTARAVMTDAPTTAAARAGVRRSSVRRSSPTRCQRVFSTGCRQARYLAHAWRAVRWWRTGSRCTGSPPTSGHHSW